MTTINSSMTNIVQFPSSRVSKTQPANTNDAAVDTKRIKANKSIFVDRLTDHYGLQLINKLAMHGFDIDSDEFMHDYIFAMEVLRACLLRNVGISHPLQELNEKAAQFLEEPDD